MEQNVSTLPPIEKDTDDWSHPRWKGVNRPYTQEDVRKLRGSVRIEYTLADSRRDAAVGVDERRSPSSARSVR